MTTDITFGLDVNKNSITSSRADMVKEQIGMLFKMKPGDDEYILEKGIDISSENYSQEGSLEPLKSRIKEQINKYTDYTAVKVDLYSNEKYKIAIGVTLANAQDTFIALIVPPQDEKSLQVFIQNQANL